MNAADLIAIWEGVRKGLLAVIGEYAPEDLDYQPFPGGYTVREIILHIAQEELGEVQYGLTRHLSAFPPPYPAEHYPAVEGLAALLSSVHQETLHYLEGLDEGDLDNEVEAGWGGTFRLADLVWHVLEHEIHHRGELSLILGLLGKSGLDA